MCEDFYTIFEYNLAVYGEFCKIQLLIDLSKIKFLLQMQEILCNTYGVYDILLYVDF